MSNLRPIIFVTHPELQSHDTGGGEHPEVPERLTSIQEKLEASSLCPVVTNRPPVPAARHWIQTCHDEAYLFRFEETVLSGKEYFGHPDNQICFESFDSALLSAGAGLTGIDLLENNEAEIIFCNVRPPGHHAEKNMALGFCFFNNVAIAARYWQQKYHRKKIVIFDFDAHHGNGIQAAFEEDPDIFYISIHEHPSFSFPGTGYSEEIGKGRGVGKTLNIPLPPGSTDEMFLKALSDKINPAINDFKPEALIISAGFDGHVKDDMSDLAYSTDLYGHLGKIIQSWADIHCNRKVLTILEGGYHLPSLANGVVNYLTGMAKSL